MKKKLFVCMGLLLCVSCQNEINWKQKRLDNALRHYNKIVSRKIPKNKVYTLQECMLEATKNNYDHAIFTYKAKVNKKKEEIANWGLLPALNTTYNYVMRNNNNASHSISERTNRESTEATISSNKVEKTFRAEMYLSFIDFGLSYYIMKQEENKSLINNLEREKALNDLLFDIIRSYYTVASAQKAMKKTEKLLKVSVIIEENLEKIARAKTISPLTILAEKKQILRLKQYLEEYKRLYENACIELVTLMGYAPEGNIQVDVKSLAKTDVDLPNCEDFIKKALSLRIELKKYDIRDNILSLEKNKKLLSLFPNVSLSLAYNNSSNSFLSNKNWYDIGSRVILDLLALPIKHKEYDMVFCEQELNDIESLAMSVAIMAQVKIAYANLNEVKRRYELADEIFQAHLEQYRIAKTEIKAGGSLSRIEIFKMSMETASASIERSQELANYKLAYFRLLNASGVKLNK